MKKFNKNLKVATLVLGLSLILPITTFAASTVDLGSASNFAILSKTGISTTGSTHINGDIGVSPISASAITGFALNLPAASAFSTSPLVTGKVYASDYATPTPTNLTTAVSSMQTAYTDAVGRTNPTATELGAGNIGGLTIAPGLYKWGTGVIIPTNVTLSGGANDVWIFQIAQTLTVSSGVNVILSGGAQASNIFWVVGGQTTIGTNAVFNGNILDQTAIVLATGAQLNGRALAQTAVTLDSNNVTIPASSSSVTPLPIFQVSCDPLPVVAGCTVTATVVNNACVYRTDCSTQASPTSVVAQSNTPVTIQVSPSLTQTTMFPGCSGGNMYNTSTGQLCVNNGDVRVISVNLNQGSRDENVTTLQQFLISQNKGLAAQYLAQVGATGYFGKLTRRALAEFQASVGIRPAVGNFGPITRAYISTH